jgi:hypothetical protein
MSRLAETPAIVAMNTFAWLRGGAWEGKASEIAEPCDCDHRTSGHGPQLSSPAIAAPSETEGGHCRPWSWARATTIASIVAGDMGTGWPVLPCGVQLSIDEILQNAHDFNPGKAMVVNLRPAVAALFRELEEKEVDYVLVGGVALLSYVEGRNTQDIDLIVKAEDAGAIDWNAKVADRDFGEASYRGVRVDLLLRTNPLFDYVAEHERTGAAFDGRRVVIATRKGLLLLKLYALPSLYRHGQLARAALYEADLRMLHQGADIDDGELLARLDVHLSKSDLTELSRILDEQRSKRRF